MSVKPQVLHHFYLDSQCYEDYIIRLLFSHIILFPIKLRSFQKK